jgi:fumarate reductase (CoM/CoB) subunit B
MKLKADPKRCLASQCDFCREGCASFLAFNLDSFSSRGKNRILDAYQSGRLKKSDLVNLAFKCMACGQCSEICITGDGIYQEIQEIREALARDKMVPPPIRNLSKKIIKTGTAFDRKDTSWVGDKDGKSRIGYFPGCGILAYNTRLASKTMELLSRYDMNAVPIASLCCSSPLFRAGLVEDARSIAMQLHNELKEKKIKTLVCSCPGCALTFKEIYPSLVSGWKLKVLHISEILVKKKDKMKKTNKKEKIIYHDPCHLARGLDISFEPKQILGASGYEILEFDKTGKESVCCGSGGNMALLYPNEAKRAARLKIEEAREAGADILATFCPLCQRALSEASKGDIPVKDVVELL